MPAMLAGAPSLVLSGTRPFSGLVSFQKYSKVPLSRSASRRSWSARSRFGARFRSFYHRLGAERQSEPAPTQIVMELQGRNRASGQSRVLGLCIIDGLVVDPALVIQGYGAENQAGPRVRILSEGNIGVTVHTITVPGASVVRGLLVRKTDVDPVTRAKGAQVDYA